MPFTVALHDDFEPEFRGLPVPIQNELLARLRLLAEFGPDLGRPNVDRLQTSQFQNMKELRFRLDGLWRFAFAFDPQRQAIVLCGGDKEGANQSKWYEQLIRTADERFAAHLKSLNPVRRSSRKP
ncbi:type II toxin-antitoxin system RelE/ParE family toxin [Methylobacterium sp. E-016]|uniref:type II toxin-antitoxin system RelE/ParE family toxin n=1 Tax=Methylobacterium sp. E-016 TaxID=2836556 RepID=UPI001FB9CEBF|nr:type II toxin-antitoxin system RelE/ParE family toxin [Methylobacterium sp. E-016]MCJ2076563.1 type II toxin-antitoxin system RelE/ParE family toxin [Methylobacterium sp. E-016]